MITLQAVDEHNWRAVAGLKVHAGQRDWVADPAYYLALCHYSPVGWQPLAMVNDGAVVVGFLMWAVDPDDGAAWLGGVIVGEEWQRRGFGRAGLTAVLELLRSKHGVTRFALSYEPANTAACQLYASLGFTETGEQEGTEVVARL